MFSLQLRLSIVLCLSMQCFTTIAEIVVVKEAAKKISALTSADKAQYSEIFKILTQYQWPTSMLYAKKAEQDILYANLENAEINFIQSQLSKLSAIKGQSYKALYIPDTVYQLAIIAYYAEQLQYPQSDTSIILIRAAEYLSTFLYSFCAGHDEYGAFNQFPATSQDFFTACKNIYKDDKDDNISNLHFLINSFLGRIVSEHATLNIETWKIITTDLVSKIIKGKKYIEDEDILPAHEEEEEEEILDPEIYGKDRFLFKFFEQELTSKKLTPGGIIDKLIETEIDAHKKNLALLFNASAPFSQPIDIFESKKNENNELLTSTLFFNSLEQLVEMKKTGDFKSHGTSYSLYPFTGTFYCKYDMPYYYARGFINYEKDRTNKNYFFALRIDKKSYAATKCNNLFIIPPFSALTQVFGLASLYHALSTIAMNNIPADVLEIDGLDPIQDSAGILIIQMDPILHAQLSSEFAAENAVLLHAPEAALWKYGENLLKNYAQAATFYREFDLRYAKIPQTPGITSQEIADKMVAIKKSVFDHVNYWHKAIPRLKARLAQEQKNLSQKLTPLQEISKNVELIKKEMINGTNSILMAITQ